MSEVQVDDDQVAEELFREQQSKGPAAPAPAAAAGNGVAVKQHYAATGETSALYRGEVIYWVKG